MDPCTQTRIRSASKSVGKSCITVAVPSWLLLMCTVAFAQSGGSFDLTWNTIDGGGGVSTGGGFELSGTIGQADASPPSALTGGGYALTGGYWIGFGPWCTSLAAPDFDMDCDVDHADFEALDSCASGPAIPYDTGCGAKDLDGDGDVDQTDFGLWQRCFSGENIAADPACMD